MKFIASVIIALLFLVAPATAQWQVPAHSLPVGLGGGNTGFNSVGPCATGVPFVGQGATTDPACAPIDLNGAGVTGTLPPARLQAVPNSALTAMPAKTLKGNNTASPLTLDLTIAQVKTLLSAVPAVTDPLYGADPTGIVDSTTAFQNIISAACGNGFGHFRVPAGRYLVTKINQTNCNNVVIDGDGDQSTIVMNGQDFNGNWWDLSGSNNISFSHLRFVDGGFPVRIGFLWACTGTNCNASGIVAGLSFDHVNVSGKFVLAGLYGYGYGPLAFSNGGTLMIANANWQNTYNGPVAASERTRTAVLMLTAYNIGSIVSSYVTVTATTAIASQTHLVNANINDMATSGSTLSNNAAIVTDGVNQFTMVGGQVACLCIADFIGWTSDEGVVFIQTAFQEPLGAVACTTKFWALFGGGVNAAIAFHNVLFSCPGTAPSAIIGLDQGISAGEGGIWFLTFTGDDVGLNSFNRPFIGKTASGCGAFAAANNWILLSNINMVSGANNLDLCGGIDSRTIIQNVGTVTLVGGATDHGAANPFR